MKFFKINKDLIFSLKLICAAFILGAYLLIVFVLLLLLITALPILALINLFIIAVGILLEILCLTDKLVFRIISDVCIILGVISFVLIVCNIFI